MGGVFRAHTGIALVRFVFLASQPIGNLLFCFFFSDAVDFLNLSSQLFTLAAITSR